MTIHHERDRFHKFGLGTSINSDNEQISLGEGGCAQKTESRVARIYYLIHSTFHKTLRVMKKKKKIQESIVFPFSGEKRNQ